jgi:enoyl-CoA hydratase/carnithine racemase
MSADSPEERPENGPDSSVLVHHVGEIAVVTLNRPEALNAWTGGMQQHLTAVIGGLAHNPATAGVVLTGAGTAFCAGQDLAETARFQPEDVDGWLDNLRALYGAMLDLDIPLIGAVNGVAAGSGYQVSMLCDVRVIHPGVRMGQPEVTSGIPSVTGLYLTEQSLGLSRTREMMLTGRLLEADELLRVGLVHHVVPVDEVVPRAVAIAAQIAAQPSMAVRLTKQRVRRMIEPGLWDAFEAAREIDREAWGSGQPQQVMRDFFAVRRAACDDQPG